MIELLWRLLDAGVSLDVTLRSTEQEFISKLQNLKILKKSNNQLIFNSRFIAGYLEFSASGSAYLRSLNSKNDDLFIDKEHLDDAKNGDLIIARRIISPRASSSGAIVLIVKRASRKILALVRNGEFLDILTSSKIDTPLDALNYENENIVELNFDATEVLNTVGSLNDAKVDEIISLAKYNRPNEFDEKIISSLPSKIPTDSNRVDLTELNFSTIDPASAKDFDDAIYFEPKSKTLYVAIADVSAYVTEGSAVDAEALRRGFSIYFAHKAIPMLPHKLSEELCSLNPNVERFAFVCEMKFDGTKVKSSKFYEAIIKSANRFTYEEIDEHLENPLGIDKKFTYIPQLYDLTKKIRQERLQTGLDFQTTEIRQHLNQDLLLEETTYERSSPSHALIEECMLLCNVEAALIMKGRGLFRIHDEPSLQKLSDLYAQLGTLGIPIKHQENVRDMFKEIQDVSNKTLMKEQIDTILIRSQMQARYYAESSEHFGLGFKTYTHFTSPIRRYSDLLVHRLIKKRLEKNEKAYDEIMKNIQTLSLDISQKERECDKVQNDFTARVYARWAKKHLNETIKADITALNPRAVATSTEPIAGLRILLSSAHNSLFDELSIKITDADILSTIVTGSGLEIKN